jgi:phage pi2 protein 07
METLKRNLREDREIDNEIRDLNKNLFEKRDERKRIESEITTILAQPQFQEYKKLQLEDDGSVFRIQRPNDWNKPWALSQKDLKTLLEEYFRSGAPKNADECHKYICERRKEDLVSKEFGFSRVLLGE